MAIRVVLAEDQRMVREALGALLAREPDIEIIGEAANGREAIERALELRPDVLVLDISLPEVEGMEVARTLRLRAPEVKVLALSVHNDPHIVREMLKAGAAGYVDKSSALEELVRAIRLVVQGKLYLSPELTRQALGPRFTGINNANLSQRERQVIALLASGKRSLQIAAELNISLATVEAHRRNIMRKLGLHTVAELTRYAVRHGLTSL
ncbi:MAG: response regulator transcription factor [Betaproteobacteria bacterium]|nr:MAG: response regulator transcription factor [Betaproteobacteria bacterium]